jgi:hypothetical protein
VRNRLRFGGQSVKQLPEPLGRGMHQCQSCRAEPAR